VNNFDREPSQANQDRPAEATEMGNVSGNEGWPITVAPPTPQQHNKAAPSTSGSGEMLGVFELKRLLGKGGMGEVWLAYHLFMNCLCALKMMRADYCGRDALARFHREIRLYARLEHPNVVRIRHAEVIDGRAVLVMEYVEGVSFQEIGQRHGCLAVADACELIRQAALGLAHAHGHGVVHRDVKPANLMLDQSLTVKVLDFGLARDGAGGIGPTLDGAILGTPEYMAPEQAEQAAKVDGRADTYALGCVLFFLLTGEPPYPRKSDSIYDVFAVLNEHKTAPVPSLTARCPDLPAGLSRLVERMMAKDPAARPGTPSEVSVALAEHASGSCLEQLLADSPAIS
jgi:serine/threonine protein kinase